MLHRKYIHEHPDWPAFRWDDRALLGALADCRHQQGLLLGALAAMGFPAPAVQTLDTLTAEAVGSSAIEGEALDPAQVRSSLAGRLGIADAGVPVTDRRVEGIVSMLMDASSGYADPLDDARLHRWHAGLFPSGVEHRPETVGAWRPAGSGSMRVVSRGRWGREQVHFVAPAPERVHREMTAFLNWFASPPVLDPVIRAGLAHLWFVTIHPYADGNGRIARAITEMALAQGDDTGERHYAMSAEIMRRRETYYHALEAAQSGDLDVTGWLIWFVECLRQSVVDAREGIAAAVSKAQRWQQWTDLDLNSRQRSIVNRLMDGFEGNLTTSKWAKIAKCSQDTALRDINRLVELGILERSPTGGRGTKYDLAAG